MRTWNGSKPTHCQVCERPIGKTFVDGATAVGWAILCPPCHRMRGRGLGTGKGQQFRLLHGVWIDARDYPRGNLTEEELKTLLALKEPYNHVPRNGGFAEPEED